MVQYGSECTNDMKFVFMGFRVFLWLCLVVLCTYERNISSMAKQFSTNALNFEQYSIVVPNFLFLFACCVFLHYRRIRTLLKRVNMYFCYHTYA